MRKVYKILTPENVYLDYELAGLGSRFAALLADSLIQVGLVVLVLVGMLAGGIDINGPDSYSSTLIAVGIALIFLIWFGYFIFFELILNGQTPGKKALKLRVIKKTGEPVGFFDSLVRNILRIADMLPVFYLAGSVLLLFSKEYRRIGDYAANTIVVRTGKSEKLVTADSLLRKTGGASAEGSMENLYPVDSFEYGVLKEFLSRKDSLGTRKPIFAYHINMYFMKKFNLEKPLSDPYTFFEEIIRMNLL